jgi:hypothetical protein
MLKTLISALVVVSCAMAFSALPQDKSEHNKDNTVHHEAMHDEHAVHHAAVHAEGWLNHHMSAPHKKKVVQHKKAVHHKKKSTHKMSTMSKSHGN